MKENEIPTAEQFLNNYWFKAEIHIGNRDYATMEEYAIDFAKLHVKQALESAAEKCSLEQVKSISREEESNYNQYCFSDEINMYTVVNKDSILSAYPEELIK